MPTCLRIAFSLTATVSIATAAFAVQAAKPAPKNAAPKDTSPVLAVVNGQPITSVELSRLMQTRRVPEAQRGEYRTKFLDQLVDAHLIQAYLDARQTTALREELDEQVNRLRVMILKEGKDFDKALAEMGYTEKSLRDELALPLAWKRHVDRTITPAKLKEYFTEHRPEFDGTKVRASHILIKISTAVESPELKAAEDKLRQLRAQIIQKKLSFADAAKTSSEGPSKDSGGDVGYFPYTGKMPADFSRVAFGLKVGEISEPFRTRFGVHLCVVTDRQPGELSLEDVRDEVLAKMSQELWEKTVAELRTSAKIEWKTTGDAP